MRKYSWADWLMIVLFLAFVGLSVFGIAQAVADERDRTCTPPALNVGPDGVPFTADDEPLVNPPASYNWFVDGVGVASTNDCSYRMTQPVGTYDVRASTVDSTGLEGPQSPPKSFTLAVPLEYPPNPPGGLQ